MHAADLQFISTSASSVFSSMAGMSEIAFNSVTVEYLTHLYCISAFDILRRQLWDVLRHVPTTIQGNSHVHALEFPIEIKINWLHRQSLSRPCQRLPNQCSSLNISCRLYVALILPPDRTIGRIFPSEGRT